MDENRKQRRWGWPLAFFILNLAAIVAWFVIYPGLFRRELVVASLTPSGTEIDSAQPAEIRLEYNLPLDPASVGDGSLRFIPPLAGKAKLTGPGTLTFTLREPLRAATSYTVVPSPEIRGERGEIPKPELLEFSTTRFKLLEANQVGYDRDYYLIELTFNQPIASSDLAAALRSQFSVPERSSGGERVQTVTNATSRTQRLRINESRNCHLLLTLPAGLCGKSGPLGLAEDARLLWRIRDRYEDSSYKAPDWALNLAQVELKPEVSFLGMTAEWDDGEGYVRVRTTSPLDPAKAKEYVSVSPDLPVTFSSAWNGLKIMGDFQPGKQYRVTLAAGMPSSRVGDLPVAVSRQVWFDDLPESFGFSHGGGFLSPEGLLKVPVKTRNLDAFRLNLRRLYASNIVEILLKDYNVEVENRYSEPEISKRIPTGGVRNQETETILDLRELVGGSPLGVYGLEIAREDRRWYSRDAVFAVSDLGLGVRKGSNRLVAWSTSIREATPREGVKISVYSNKRQLLAEGVSDKNGVAGMDLPPLPEGETVALVLGEGEKGEFSYVRLDRDNRSRGGESRRGQPYVDGFEVFLTADRGVYRGGETVHVTGLARGEELADAPELPLELRLYGPDHKLLRTQAATADALGRIAHDLTLGESYPGGVYTLEARLPGQENKLGAAMFRIADYIPETLAIAMEFEEKRNRDQGEDLDPITGHELLIKVSRLAGGELGNVPVTLIASYAAAPFSPKKWEEWHFGDRRLAGRHVDRREREVTLQHDGAALVEWNDPPLTFPAAAEMTVRVEARDMGGRAASEIIRKTIHPVPFYTGVLAPKRQPEAKTENIFRLAAVAPDGSLHPADGKWTGRLMRIEYTHIMKRRSDGGLAYEWVKREIPEAELSGSWKGGESQVAVTPVAGGQYQLIIDVDEGRDCVVDVSVSGSGAAWYGEDPETLTLTLDASSYKVGDKATVSTVSPFEGLALITVETDEVLDHWVKEFTEGENTFEVPVVDAMRPNAYVGVTLLRPAQAEEEWRPHRLSGTALLRVDNTDRRLLVEIESSDKLTPLESGEVSVKVVRDGEPVANAPVVLWAVDVGVLSLTHYQTPSPWDAFYSLRRSGVTEADMFSRLAPELSAWIGHDASPGGGDGPYGELARRLNPVFANRVKAAVIHSAELVTDENGVAATSFPVPEFAGRLRLMCWTASGQAMGAKEREVEVVAPVSVRASWPRFAAPGDVLEVPVMVINRSGKAGTARIEMQTGGNLTFEPEYLEVEVADNQNAVATFKVKCGDPGVATASVTAKLDGHAFSDKVEFSVRPPFLFARESGSITLEPGEERAFVLAPGMMAKNSRVKLLAGGHPLINLAGSLDYLLSYPYGCAEQTASRLLALVYLPDLLALSRPGQLESGEVDFLATACIERLQTMQSDNGAIKMWPKAEDELYWVSAQAMFTLMESRAAGHSIPDQLVNRLASYLEDRMESQMEHIRLDTSDGEAVAMACLGMAKADKLKRSWLLRLEELADARRSLGSPLSSAALAFLCESVAAAGDVEAATALYKRFNPSGPEAGLSRNRVTELASWLLASMALGVNENEQAAFAGELGLLAKDGFTRWSTKENSLILTALGRYWQKVGPLPEATASLRRNGVTTEFSTRRGGSWDKLSSGERVEIKNPAEGSLRLFWLAEGVPLTGTVKQEDKGIVARRRIFDSAGHEVEGPFVLNRGEVYEVSLQVTGLADDLVLVDLLPAGLEIEDATLKGRKLDKKTSRGISVKNVEIRDDRLLVFASVRESGEYRYLVRAVTGGRFVWPALDASRMYDAATRSVHGAGELVVQDREAANDM